MRINNCDQQTCNVLQPMTIANTSRGSQKMTNIIQGKSTTSVQILHINLILPIGPSSPTRYQTIKRQEWHNPLVMMGLGALKKFHATHKEVCNTWHQLFDLLMHHLWYKIARIKNYNSRELDGHPKFAGRTFEMNSINYGKSPSSKPLTPP